MKEMMNEWNKLLAKASVLTESSSASHWKDITLDGIRLTEGRFLKEISLVSTKSQGGCDPISPALLCHPLWVSCLSPGLTLAHAQGGELENSCVMCQPCHVKMGHKGCKHSGLWGLG